LGARWLSPASDPRVLTSVECWPQVHIAHLTTSQGVPRDEWWTGGNAPLLVIQGLDDIVAPPANGPALRDQLGERVQVVDIPRAGHFVIVEQPDPVAAAVTEFIGGRRVNLQWRGFSSVKVGDKIHALLAPRPRLISRGSHSHAQVSPP